MQNIFQRGTALWLILMIGLLLVAPLPQIAQSQDPAPQRIESDDPAVTRLGNWTSQAATDASGGSYLFNSSSPSIGEGSGVGTVLQLEFSGPSVEVIYVAGPSLGTLAINVDDTVLRTVITTADQTAYQQSARIDYLSDEPHILKVYAQEGGVVAIDAFVIPTPSPSPMLGEGNAEGETRDPFCAPTNQIHRVSLTSTGGQADDASLNPSISADGRYVEFFSYASLVPGDGDDFGDIYLYDRATCTIELLSMSSLGEKGNNESPGAFLSGDGRYTAFSSFATNLVSGDTNATIDVFVRDHQMSTTTRINVATDGTEASGGPSYIDGITPDGRYVVFTSYANNLVAGDSNNDSDIFVHDRQTGTTSRASLAYDGTEINSASSGVISADGRYVAFVSNDNSVIADDTNTGPEIFVRDRQNETTTRVSVATGGVQTATGSAGTPTISSDGRYVAFYSASDDLVTGDTNGFNDVFVHDRNTNTTTRVSVASDGTQAIGGNSLFPEMSYDGRYIVFESRATNLVVGTVNGNNYAYVHDRQTGITSLISLTEVGSPFVFASPSPVLSGDGQFVAFASEVTTLVSDDTNNQWDIFVTPRFPGASSLTATSLDDGRIQLNWTDNASDETEYRIERSPDGLNNWVEIGTAPANTTTYTNVSLICGTPYHYRVRAYRASDTTYSGYSNVATATTAACPTSCNSSDVIRLVSRASNGTQANLDIDIIPAISDDGRWITFSSAASNLVVGDTNNHFDVFVHDRLTCATTRISVASDGTQGNGQSNSPSISGDGRYVAFQSHATNLVSGDSNGDIDVFVHDRQTGITTRVSVATDGDGVQGGGSDPGITSNGRYVTFSSVATNLVPGDTNGYEDVFVHDRINRTTTRVSIASDGTQGIGISSGSVISDDGRYVAFLSEAGNLTAGDTYNTTPDYDVFVHDRLTGTTTRISVAPDGTEANGASYPRDISADGRYVAFDSTASNLVAGDTNGNWDVFVHDRQTGINTRISMGVGGAEANGISYTSDISADGRYVAFSSIASNLVSGDTNGTYDIFVFDRITGFTTRVSIASDGTQSNNRSYYPSISTNGRYVAYSSSADNLVSGDTNQRQDIFVRDLSAPSTLAIINPATRSANLVHSLTNPPAAGDYTQFATGLPFGAGGQYLTGDWDGDGLETLGVYRNGAFFFTNDYGTGATWGGVWFGLGGQPVAGRFDANVGHDCLGVTDSGTWINGDTYFALYYTCNLTSGPTPPLSFQWLSILLPNSVGFTGTFQFVAGDFDGDGVDSIAVRRGNVVAWTNVPPTNVYSAFQYAQYLGIPGTGDEGKVVVGDWDLNHVDSFGLVYQNGQFYRRNDVEWNTGVYIFQQFTPLVGTPFDVASWRPN